MNDFPIKDELFSATFWQGLAWILITCMSALIGLLYEMKMKWRQNLENIDKTLTNINTEQQVLKEKLNASLTNYDNNFINIVEKQRENRDLITSVNTKVDMGFSTSNIIVEKLKELDSGITILKQHVMLNPIQQSAGIINKRLPESEVESDKIREILSELRRTAEGR
jgi:hypothetical protein